MRAHILGRIALFFMGLSLLLVACDSVEKSWEQAERQSSALAYNQFAEKYPDSPEAKVALRRAEALTWPPPPGGTAEAPAASDNWGNLSGGSGGYGEGWGYVKDADGNKARWGPLYVDGVFEIDRSIFSVSEPPTSYADPDNHFEVLYYDDTRTVIRLDPQRGHRLLLEGGVPAGNSRIEYAGREYRLKQDGWYVTCEALAGKKVLVYSFAETISVK